MGQCASEIATERPKRRVAAPTIGSRRSRRRIQQQIAMVQAMVNAAAAAATQPPQQGPDPAPAAASQDVAPSENVVDVHQPQDRSDAREREAWVGATPSGTAEVSTTDQQHIGVNPLLQPPLLEVATGADSLDGARRSTTAVTLVESGTADGVTTSRVPTVVVAPRAASTAGAEASAGVGLDAEKIVAVNGASAVQSTVPPPPPFSTRHSHANNSSGTTSPVASSPSLACAPPSEPAVSELDRSSSIAVAVDGAALQMEIFVARQRVVPYALDEEAKAESIWAWLSTLTAIDATLLPTFDANEQSCTTSPRDADGV